MGTLVERMTSSKRQNYRTPSLVLGLINQLGPITFDPTTTVSNPTNAFRWSTTRGLYERSSTGVARRVSASDGMTADWCAEMRAVRSWLPQFGIIYSNPTYRHLSRPVPRHRQTWTDKIVHEGNRLQRGGALIVLVPSRVETDWFRRMMCTAARRLDWGSPTLGSRLKFEGSAARESALFPVTLFLWSHQQLMLDAFEQVFAPHGTYIFPRACRMPAFRVKAAEGRADGVATLGSPRPSAALTRSTNGARR